MLSRRVFILTLVSVTALTGCPPKKNKKEVLRTGRTRYSPTGGKNANGQTNSYTSANAQTLWGGISAIDQNFDQAVRTLAKPSLDGAPQSDQLGQVNPQPGDSQGIPQGIYFWGNVAIGANGQVDSNRSKLHLEIFDSNYGMPRTDGTYIEQLFIHVGADQEGFISVSGTQNNLVFMASYGSFMLQGQVQGSNYVGTIYFANKFTQDFTTLGQFTVPAQGFFTN